MERHLTQRYQSREGAHAYRHKYERSWTRRMSHRREMRMVAAALAHADAQGHVLDCPCGAGRLVPTLLARAEHVTAADLSAAMLAEAQEALSAQVKAGKVTLVEASADRLPFEPDAFDTVVCHRLLHHVSDRTQRARILAELARVARRRVVLSFHDARTWKMRWQRWRSKTRRRIAWHPADLAAEALDQGLVLESPVHRLNGLFSLVAAAVFRVDAEPGPGGS